MMGESGALGTANAKLQAQCSIGQTAAMLLLYIDDHTSLRLLLGLFRNLLSLLGLLL